MAEEFAETVGEHMYSAQPTPVERQQKERDPTQRPWKNLQRGRRRYSRALRTRRTPRWDRAAPTSSPAASFAADRGALGTSPRNSCSSRSRWTQSRPTPTTWAPSWGSRRYSPRRAMCTRWQMTTASEWRANTTSTNQRWRTSKHTVRNRRELARLRWTETLSATYRLVSQVS